MSALPPTADILVVQFKRSSPPEVLIFRCKLLHTAVPSVRFRPLVTVVLVWDGSRSRRHPASSSAPEGVLLERGICYFWSLKAVRISGIDNARFVVPRGLKFRSNQLIERAI